MGDLWLESGTTDEEATHLVSSTSAASELTCRGVAAGRRGVEDFLRRNMQRCERRHAQAHVAFIDVDTYARFITGGGDEHNASTTNTAVIAFPGPGCAHLRMSATVGGRGGHLTVFDRRSCQS